MERGLVYNLLTKVIVPQGIHFIAFKEFSSAPSCYLYGMVEGDQPHLFDSLWSYNQMKSDFV